MAEAVAGVRGDKWRVAVLGAGPSGLYAADALVRHGAEVDVFERLFAPQGLVRYGVAPDHQKIKKTGVVFDRILSLPGVRFLGNVEVGRDVSIEELLARYDQVLVAVGASGGRRLGIPGEELRGSFTATEFVGWYNGHPDFLDLDPPLDERVAVVVGAGNVAIDVARILLQGQDILERTDISPRALRMLAASAIEEVVVLARRGPDQAAFDVKEVRALLALPDVEIRATGFRGGATSEQGKFILELPRTGVEPRRRRIVFRFCASPVELRGHDGRVEFVRIEESDLIESAGSVRVVGSGRYELLEAGLCIRAIGYQAVAFPGLPFEPKSGTVPNDAGRVLLYPSGPAAYGLYVTGWIKRGPTGLIGTNKACAVETVTKMVEDHTASLAEERARAARATLPPGPPERVTVDELLSLRGVRVVSWDDWQKLDAWEQRRGALRGAVREKIERTEDALRLLDESG